MDRDLGGKTNEAAGTYSIRIDGRHHEQWIVQPGHQAVELRDFRRRTVHVARIDLMPGYPLFATRPCLAGETIGVADQVPGSPVVPMAEKPHISAEAERDAFVEALDALDRALDVNVVRALRMRTRIKELQKACATGRPISDIIPEESAPLIVELLTQNTETLHTYGSQVRRAEARVLHAEGMPMEQIARLFGVTRQRVSTLLRAL